MNWKRIGRALVCLLVVCCLVINISPIRADAVSTGVVVGTALSIGAVYVVASTLLGLGVMPGSDTTAFDDLVDSAVSFLSDAGVVVGGLVQVWSLFGANYKYAVDQSFIETLREWLFAKDIVSSSLNYTGWVSSLTATVLGREYVIRPYKTDDCMYPQLVSIRTCVDGTYRTRTFVVHRYRTCYINDQYFNTESSFISGAYFTPVTLSHDWNDQHIADTLHLGDYVFDSEAERLAWLDTVQFPFLSISVADGLVAGDIATEDESLQSGYATWADNAISIPNSETDEDDYIPVWPMGFGQTYEDTRDQTQLDVWTGSSSYVDSEADTGAGVITGTFADTAVGSFISALIDALLAPLRWLAETLLDGIKAIFVPSADYVSAKVEALRAEFAFADAIISTGEFIGTSLADIQTEPPVIYIDLGASRGSYKLGGVVPFVDLRWYEEYKPAGDALLSAFLWIVFAWRMFVKAPGIISGMPGDFVLDGVNHLGLADSLPSRKKEYALQRQNNRKVK